MSTITQTDILNTNEPTGTSAVDMFSTGNTGTTNNSSDIVTHMIKNTKRMFENSFNISEDKKSEIRNNYFNNDSVMMVESIDALELISDDIKYILKIDIIGNVKDIKLETMYLQSILNFDEKIPYLLPEFNVNLNMDFRNDPSYKLVNDYLISLLHNDLTIIYYDVVFEDAYIKEAKETNNGDNWLQLLKYTTVAKELLLGIKYINALENDILTDLNSKFAGCIICPRMMRVTISSSVDELPGDPEDENQLLIAGNPKYLREIGADYNGLVLNPYDFKRLYKFQHLVHPTDGDLNVFKFISKKTLI